MKLIILNILIVLIVSFSNAQELNDEKRSYFYAESLYKAQKLDSAIIVLQQQKSSSQCNLLLADIYYQNLKHHEAIHLYETLSDTYPSEAYFYLSKIYASLNNSIKSIEMLKKHFEYSNKYSYSQILSHSEFENIKFSKEWSNFWEVNKYSNNELKLEEARYLILQSKYLEAIEILLNLNFTSQFAQINFLIAKSYYELNNIKLAEKFIDIYISKNHTYENSLFIKYKILLLENKYKHSLEYIQKLEEFYPFKSEYLYEYANSLNLAGDNEQSLQKINEYLYYLPNDVKAKELKASILSNSNNFR